MHLHPSGETSWSLASLSSALSVSLKASDGFFEMTEYAASTTATETVAGDAKGYVSARKIKKGTGGTAMTQKGTKYFGFTVSGESVYPVARETV